MNLNFTKINFNELKKQIEDKLKYTYNKNNDLFSSASPYGQIITVISGIASLIFQYIENYVTDTYDLNKTNNKDSIIRWSTIMGRNPTRRISASGRISLKVKKSFNTIILPSKKIILSDKLVLKNTINNLYYSILLGSNELEYEIDNSNIINLQIVQGKFSRKQFISNGTKLQTISLTDKNIEFFNVEVYINGEKYINKENLYDLNWKEKACLIKTNSLNSVDIIFGNNRNGLIPNEGSLITIDYLISDGSRGNINTDDINQFKFDTDIKDSLGNTVSLNDIFDIEIYDLISFGSNEENIEFTRKSIPKTSRNYVLVNPEQYKNILMNLNMFSSVDAFSNINDNNPNNDNIVYVYLIPNIALYLKSNETYFNLEPDAYLLNENEKDKIYKFIKKQGIQLINTDFKILDLIFSRYIINIYLKIKNESIEERIKNEIFNIISNYFINLERKYIIPKSDLINQISEISNIISIDLEFISNKNESYHIKGNEILGYNPNLILGLDERGNIKIEKNEIVLIRGGWDDRYGNYYSDKPNLNLHSAVNIIIEDKI